MEILAKHFWEKEGKLQEAVKTDTWHFNIKNKKNQEEMYWLQNSIHYEVLPYLHCIDICLG